MQLEEQVRLARPSRLAQLVAKALLLAKVLQLAAEQAPASPVAVEQAGLHTAVAQAGPSLVAEQATTEGLKRQAG